MLRKFNKSPVYPESVLRVDSESRGCPQIASVAFECFQFLDKLTASLLTAFPKLYSLFVSLLTEHFPSLPCYCQWPFYNVLQVTFVVTKVELVILIARDYGLDVDVGGLFWAQPIIGIH